MNAELRAIGLDELRQMVVGLSDGKDIVQFSRLADPLFAATYKDTLLGFIGFIPITTLSDSAYIWVHTLPAVDNHKLVTARLARRCMPIFYSRYPKLAGHCVNRPSSIAWLTSLGAVFGESVGPGLVVFALRNSHG